MGPNYIVFKEVWISQLGREDDLGRLQPDWVIVSEAHKKLAIVDLCRPTDVHPDQLLVEGGSKQRSITLNKAWWFMPSSGWWVFEK